MNETYQVLDIEENIDGSANILVRAVTERDPVYFPLMNILVRAVTERDPVYFMLMNIRDDAVEGVVYDLLIGHEAESGGIEWLKETESSEQYMEILDDVIDDVLRGDEGVND